MGVEDEVLTGISGSRLLQPSEFIESRNEFDAMVGSAWLQDRAALGLALAQREACSTTGLRGVD